MKRQIITGILLIIISISGCINDKVNDNIPLAPTQNRRPENFKPFKYEYSPEDLKVNFSDEMMQLAAIQYEKLQKLNSTGKWKPTLESIESHETPEWFEDAKFGMFIDWGLWSVAGWAPKKENSKAMYPDWYEKWMYTDSATIGYHKKNWGEDFERDDFIPLFTAEKYNPEKLAGIASEAGMKYIVPFCKHHAGFCLWPSSFTHRDAYDMGPKKDLIAPLVESCKKEGLKFGFYFSLEEWEYPLISDDNKLAVRRWGGKTVPYSSNIDRQFSGKVPVKNFAGQYIVPQATEFIDKYDPDILWYDGEWDTSVKDLQSYEIAAYFYNNAEGRKEVALNDRLGLSVNDPSYESLPGPDKDKKRRWHRFVSGDFFTSEYHSHANEDLQRHAWEECRGISQSFGYNWQDTDENVISPKKFIDMFTDIVANGGNLLLIVNLDEQGALPKIQETRLKDIGKWLKVNGEGIYNTRPYSVQSDGIVAYTMSKDGQFLYAILKEWPGNMISLKGINAKPGSRVEMLGYDHSLDWSNTDADLNIKLDDNLQDENQRPCKHAWVIKILKVKA